MSGSSLRSPVTELRPPASGPERPPRFVPPPESLTTAQRLLRWLGAAACLAVTGFLVWGLWFLVPPVVLGFLAFYVLNLPVNLLENRGLSRGLAVALCLGTLLLALIAIALSVWPTLEGWLQQAPSQGAPSPYEVQLEARLASGEEAGRRAYPQLDWSALFGAVRGFLEEQRRQLTETLPTMILGILSSAGSGVVAFFIALFLLLDGAKLHRQLVSLVPNRHFETVLLLLHRVDRQIASYLRGTAAESATVAVLLSTVLTIAGMPGALLLACLGGIANVLPILGPVLGTGMGLLFALMDPSAPSLLLLLGCYAAVYGFDALVINPWIFGRSLNLHPLTVVVGLFVGGALGGIPGMLACIPLIAIAKAIGVTLREAHQKGQIGLGG